MHPTRRDFLALTGAAAGSLALPSLSLAADEVEAKSPYRFIKTFDVVSGLSGSSRKLVAAPRASGGFLALWEQASGGKTASFARPYTGKRKPAGGNLKVMADTLDRESVGSVVTHPNGTSNLFLFGKPSPTASTLWWMQRLNAAGSKIGPLVKIGAGLSGNYHHSARFADGRMICAWNDLDTFGNFAKIVSPTGAVLAETPTSLFHNFVEGVAALPGNAGAVLASYWGSAEVAFHIVDDKLQKVGDPLLFPAAQGYAAVVVAPHPLGFVAVWTAATLGTIDPFIDGAIFSKTGAVIRRFAPIRLKPGLDQNNGHELFPALLTLPNGKILFARNRRAVDKTGRDLYQIVLHLYGPDGRPAALPTIAYQDRAQLGEFFVHVNYPRSLIRIKGGSLILTFDTGPWGGPHVAKALNFRVA